MTLSLKESRLLASDNDETDHLIQCTSAIRSHTQKRTERVVSVQNEMVGDPPEFTIDKLAKNLPAEIRTLPERSTI